MIKNITINFIITTIFNAEILQKKTCMKVLQIKNPTTDKK